MFQVLTDIDTYATISENKSKNNKIIPQWRTKFLATKLEERISVHYGELSVRQKLAADFVVSNPFEIATRSMRSIASSSNLSPATYTRLARAVGFEDYDQLKSLCVSSVNRNKVVSFYDRAIQLTDENQDQNNTFFYRQASASIQNIEELLHSVDTDKLSDIVEILAAAPRVGVAGALASSGFAHYMSYIGGWCRANWFALGNEMLGSGFILRDLEKEDVVFMITKTPNSQRSMSALKFAHENGNKIILITDTHKCPAITYANHFIVVPTDSPQFFSSYVATTVLLETIIGMLVTKMGDVAHTRIASIEDTNRQIGEYWSG